ATEKVATVSSAAVTTVRIGLSMVAMYLIPLASFPHRRGHYSPEGPRGYKRCGRLPGLQSSVRLWM
ncbi:MAG: hypothetical protein NDI66_07700, partial [Pseudomonas sp.]|nr:hypothetical protein [Pseudomonas sp.]